MLTHVIELTADQRDAVVAALNERAGGCLDRMRQSIGSGILTAQELRDQVNLDLRWLRQTLAALTPLAPDAKDRWLTELTGVMLDYRRELQRLEDAERQMIAWNARAEEEKSRHSTAAVTA